MFKYDFEVPKEKQYRVIVHTDCKNEADDQFAVAHHLMTPKYEVMGLVAAHFCGNPQEYGEGNTAKASYAEIEKVMDLMGLTGEYPVLLGAETAMPDTVTPVDSEGAQFIIKEAMREDSRPLYIACQGSITDIASALLLKPEIAERMTVIWIGGGDYPAGGTEFNLMMDIHAANVLFASKTPVWQIPKNTYKQVCVSLAELQYHVKPCGEIGKYLFEQMVAFNKKVAWYPTWPHGEIWGLGDQGTIGVLLQELEKVDYDMYKAPFVREDMSYDMNTDNREIRVYHTLDTRMLIEDFYCKLAINFRDK